MRSFENRPDTAVIDEPLYGFYLARTGISHPGREEILAAMPTDWREVIRNLTAGQLPAGTSVCYGKHMTHHLLPEVDRAALRGLRHAYLIRDPGRLLASYAKVRQAPTMADLGLAQQAEIFQMFGGPVIDAGDLTIRPRQALEALCDALGIPFDPAMLSWPAGPRPTDGVWAKYWYASVWRSTGFAARTELASPAGAAEPASPAAHHDPAAAPGSREDGDATETTSDLNRLAELCQPYYDELSAHRIVVS